MNAARALVSQGIRRGTIIKTGCQTCGNFDVMVFIAEPRQRPVEPIFLCKKHYRIAEKQYCSSVACGADEQYD